ncbi:aggregation-promoting factor C-terminal-like domain-containing protein [Microbacterium timonense]|uniref:aggregation-promoting factor C-terminal-like domain-containing protein n=1 Tax=Microbacterium timonense TaxID=2086576 RepID=UPI000D0EF70C|nr:phospholipase [Microbacterium timonense]
MHSDKSRAHARRRSRFFVPGVAAGTALGVLATVGLTLASPTLAAAAPVAASAIVSVAAPGATAGTLRDIRTDAQSTLLAARTAANQAEAVEADIAASGLDVGVPDTTIDTSALEESIDRLSDLELAPILLVPTLTADAEQVSDKVSARTADLRERLDAAKAQKAAEEAAAAAAAAAAEAQRQAEAAAAALAAANTPEGAKATARQLAASQYGWGDGQFSCLQSLWNKESGWNYQAYNAGSGATGIPQSLPGNKMASAGADWQTNAATQIRWGLDYIARAYGTPCAAWGHSQATNWY